MRRFVSSVFRTAMSQSAKYWLPKYAVSGVADQASVPIRSCRAADCLGPVHHAVNITFVEQTGASAKWGSQMGERVGWANRRADVRRRSTTHSCREPIDSDPIHAAGFDSNLCYRIQRHRP